MNRLKKLENYSMSDVDIKKVFKPKNINIVEYQNYQNINTLTNY